MAALGHSRDPRAVTDHAAAMTVRPQLLLAAAAIIGVMMMAASTGHGANDIRFRLDGEPIGLERAAQLHCHDFDYPVITCFRTLAALEAEAARRMRSTREGSTPADAARVDTLDAVAASLTSGYVQVFADGAYGGSSAALSVDYSNLGAIGWDDRISSFKSFGASGRFHIDPAFSGNSYVFGTTAQVSYVGDSWNDRFSSLNIT